MFNHNGSYLLNEVLILLEEASVFDALGKKKAQDLVFEIAKISDSYDCSSGEVLEDIGEKVGVCCGCAEKTDDFYDGVCKRCYEDLSAGT